VNNTATESKQRDNCAESSGETNRGRGVETRCFRPECSQQSASWTWSVPLAEMRGEGGEEIVTGL
jgi:hypothetical protein